MKKDENKMTIGTLAKNANVNVETVRFYERKGLIKQPLKKVGFRYYSFEDVRKIRFIKRAQGLGFTLEEIKELISMELCSPSNASKIQNLSKEKIKSINQKIEDLSLMLVALQKFSKTCGRKKGHARDCGIVDCFENEWECC